MSAAAHAQPPTGARVRSTAAAPTPAARSGSGSGAVRPACSTRSRRKLLQARLHTPQSRRGARRACCRRRAGARRASSAPSAWGQAPTARHAAQQRSGLMAATPAAHARRTRAAPVHRQRTAERHRCRRAASGTRLQVVQQRVAGAAWRRAPKHVRAAQKAAPAVGRGRQRGQGAERARRVSAGCSACASTRLGGALAAAGASWKPSQPAACCAAAHASSRARRRM